MEGSKNTLRYKMKNEVFDRRQGSLEHVFR